MSFSLFTIFILTRIAFNSYSKLTIVNFALIRIYIHTLIGVYITTLQLHLNRQFIQTGEVTE